MTIKLAFATVACPDWTIQQIAQQGKAMGYDGVELRTLGEAATSLAGDPARLGADVVRTALQDAGLAPACLSTSASLHYREKQQGTQAHEQMTRAIALAAELGCPNVRIFGHDIESWQTRHAGLERIAGRVLPLAEQAAKVGVTILFENAGGLCTAREWWQLLELVQQPNVSLLWNVANAAAAGEGAVASVAVLNTRIRMAKVKDLRLNQEGERGFTQLGEGDVGVATFVNRLRGIGFDGWISVEWDRLWLPALAPAEAYLPEAAKRLRGWINPAPKPAPVKKVEKAPAPAAPPVPAAPVVAAASATGG